MFAMTRGMPGGIAEAYWGVPAEIEAEVVARLPEALVALVQEFRGR